jgi:CAAX amino terminal protease family protein
MFKCDFNPLASELALAEGITSMSDYAKHLLIVIPLAVLINPIMGLVQCFGEELGWRGYLLPKLTKELSKFSGAFGSSRGLGVV